MTGLWPIQIMCALKIVLMNEQVAKHNVVHGKRKRSHKLERASERALGGFLFLSKTRKPKSGN